MLEEEKHPNKLTMPILTDHDKIGSIHLAEFLCRESKYKRSFYFFKYKSFIAFLFIKKILDFYIMHKYLVRNPKSRNSKGMEEIRATNKHDLQGFYTNEYKSKLFYCFYIIIRNMCTKK